MAKRTKSKKHPKNKEAAQVPAPDANENAAPSETTAAPLTADPTIPEASTSAFTEEAQPRVAATEFADEAVAVETEHAEASPEYGEVWSSDAPVAEAVAAEAVWAAQTVEGGETPAAASDSETRESAPTDATEGSEVVPIDWAEGGEAPLVDAAEGDPAERDPAEGDPAEGDPAEGDPAEGEEAIAGSRLESILESLLFASDKPLGMAELKRLLGERDNKKVTAAVQSLTERRKGTGVEVAALSSGWHLRTNPEHAAWVSKLLVGRPVRLSRAMLETLAIVAYRQPVTRPEVDDIRGVDCGPVLKTLLDRGLVRIIGKKEEVGRPMLYGTTPEFLRIFNLRDLSELPTLREFYDLSAEDQSRVEAEHGAPEETPSATSPKPDVALNSVMRGALRPEPEDTDPLLDELDEASQLAKQALGELEPAAPDDEGASEASRGGGGGVGPEAPEGRGASEASRGGGGGVGPEAPEGRGASEASRGGGEAGGGPEAPAGGVKTGEEPPASPPAAGE
jgi:segregation and condensation protein B